MSLVKLAMDPCHERQTEGPAPRSPKTESKQTRQRQKQEWHNWTQGGCNKDDNEVTATQVTTMICNIPVKFGKEDIVSAIESVGFPGLYDSVYVPRRGKGKHMGNEGYAFVGFKDPETAAQFKKAFQDYQFQGTNSTKKCAVKYVHLQIPTQ